jgi:NTE family protein
MVRRGFDHEILLLQGGGALGAYQAGVYEGLDEVGIAPTWVVGISIGAINASLIAGNPPERRVKRLREFWRRMSIDTGSHLPAWFDALRPTANRMAAMTAMTFGVPGFYVPRIPPPWLAAPGDERALSFYDTSPLLGTLKELVDFDLINRRGLRLSLGAVDVCKGSSVYFDNGSTAITADHVRASGALPPGFPPVAIDGRHYWDGGVVTNTPLTYVADQKPMTTARIIQVDNFLAEGELPQDLGGVAERRKDIQYASRSRFNVERLQELGDIEAAMRRLLDKLPAELKADPDARKLADVCDERSWMIIRLINRRHVRTGAVKDFEFSRNTIEEAWEDGLDDVRRSLSSSQELRAEQVGRGVQIYRPTEELPLPAAPARRFTNGDAAARKSEGAARIG